MTVGNSEGRQLPILSRAMFFPVQLLFGGLHVILSNVAPKIEPVVSCFVVSGFFGIMPLTMISFAWGLGTSVELLGACSASVFWSCVIQPFLALYTVNILVLDKSHTQVKDSGPILPSNALEQACFDFLWAFVDYFDDYMTCLPWTKDATLPTGEDNPSYIFGCHPHGIHCSAQIELSNPCNQFAKLFPNVTGRKLTGLCATVIFKIPVVRELFLAMGYIDASRSVASKALECGQSLFV